MASEGVLSLSQIESWRSTHFTDYALECRHAADYCRTVGHAQIAALTASHWEGHASDQATNYGQRDRNRFYSAADAADHAAGVADAGAFSVHQAKQDALDAVNVAVAAGFRVNEDLSVTAPNNSNDAVAAGWSHATNIRRAALELVAHDHEVGGRVIAAGNRIKLDFGDTGTDTPTKKPDGKAGTDHPKKHDDKSGAKDVKDGEPGTDSPPVKGSHSRVKDAGAAGTDLQPSPVMTPVVPVSPMPVSPMTQTAPMTAAPMSAASSFGSLSSPLRSMPSPSAFPSVPPPITSVVSGLTGGGVNSAALTPPPPIVSAAPVTVSTPVTPPVVSTPQQPVVPTHPPAVVQPPSAPIVQAPPPAPIPAQVQQSIMPLMPPTMMAPPPAAPPSAQVSVSAPPVTPAAASANAVIPVTPLERARQNIARMVRHMIGDLPGETRRLAAALAASTKDRPEIEWCVGGHRQADGAALFIVSNNIGLGFMPAHVRLPAHTTIHVFADAEHIDWAIKLGWIGAPLRAVIGYGIHTHQPVVTVAGTTAELTQYAADHPEASVHQLTPDELPDRGIVGGLNRLQIVNPVAAEKITDQSLAALVEALPIGVEPDPVRRADLWGQVLVSTDRVETWRAFCANEAAASAWHATHTSDETTAREHVSDYHYWSWNTAQVNLQTC